MDLEDIIEVRTQQIVELIKKHQKQTEKILELQEENAALKAGITELIAKLERMTRNDASSYDDGINDAIREVKKLNQRLRESVLDELAADAQANGDGYDKGAE